MKSRQHYVLTLARDLKKTDNNDKRYEQTNNNSLPRQNKRIALNKIEKKSKKMTTNRRDQTGPRLPRRLPRGVASSTALAVATQWCQWGAARHPRAPAATAVPGRGLKQNVSTPGHCNTGSLQQNVKKTTCGGVSLPAPPGQR